MNETIAWLMLGSAVVVVGGLGMYALLLWRKVKSRDSFRREEIRRANENCLESLEVIARAMLADQVDLTEGSLRCKVLLEIIDPKLLERPSLRIFAEVHQRTAHLHTHSSRRVLTPLQRLQEDRQRHVVEDELRTGVLDAAHAVIDFKQRWPAGLH
ncbi:Protein of unknown function [Modicisalibacter muralis]|uniref:DUF2489 domain-containing protein n=1 Tax=Modicisalibacter muralis TaxID=119000 RepID=A0A1G9G502_9GAMM|nr:DUF2489 domain-containing protein [Halomonas muralis]SDK95677.1 Protein of unknown function [Halomonas muralis]